LDWVGWTNFLASAAACYLTPFDFSLWGQVKTVLYNSPTETAEELMAVIMGVFQVVQTTPGLFSTVYQSMLHDVASAMCLGGGISNIFCKNLTDSCSRFMTFLFWFHNTFCTDFHSFSFHSLCKYDYSYYSFFYYTSIHVQNNPISSRLLKVGISQ
jgi:hypothetical protein